MKHKSKETMLETAPVRNERNKRIPPPVIQVTDATIIALIFLAVAWLAYLIMSNGDDAFGLFAVVLTKDELIKRLEGLRGDAQILITMQDWAIKEDGSLIEFQGEYIQFEIADVIDCGIHCHAELIVGEIVGG